MEARDASFGSCKSQVELPKFSDNLDFQKLIDVDRAIADEDLMKQHSSGGYEEMDTELEIGVEDCARVSKEIEDIQILEVTVTPWQKTEELSLPLPHNCNLEKVNNIDSESYKLSFSHNSTAYPTGNSVRLAELPKFAEGGFNEMTQWNWTKMAANDIDSEPYVLSSSLESKDYLRVENSGKESVEIGAQNQGILILPPARENAQLKELVVSLPTPVYCNFASKWLLECDHKPKVKMKCRVDCVEFYYKFSHHYNSVSLGLLWRCASKFEASISLVTSIFSQDYFSEIFDTGSSRHAMDPIGGVVEQLSGVVEEESMMLGKDAIGNFEECGKYNNFSLQFCLDAKAGGGKIDHGQLKKGMELEHNLQRIERLSHARQNAPVRELTVVLPISAGYSLSLSWLLNWFPRPKVKMKTKEVELGDLISTLTQEWEKGYSL